MMSTVIIVFHLSMVTISMYSCMYKSILEFTIHPQYLCTENLDLYSHVARPLSAARHLLLAVEVPTPATRKPYIYAVCQIF